MSMTAKRIGIDERRARLGVRHHLAVRAASVVDAARGVVCLHATDPATVYLSAWARMREPTLQAVDRALYDDRQVIRMLAMRRTMFVVPIDDAPILHAAASLAVARTERRRNEELVALLDVEDVGGWLRAAEDATLAALEQSQVCLSCIDVAPGCGAFPQRITDLAPGDPVGGFHRADVADQRGDLVAGWFGDPGQIRPCQGPGVVRHGFAPP